MGVGTRGRWRKRREEGLVEEVRRVGDEQARDEEMVRTYKEEEGGGRCEPRHPTAEWSMEEWGLDVTSRLLKSCAEPSWPALSLGG